MWKIHWRKQGLNDIIAHSKNYFLHFQIFFVSCFVQVFRLQSAACKLPKKLKYMYYYLIISSAPSHLQSIIPHLRTSKQSPFFHSNEFAMFFWIFENGEIITYFTFVCSITFSIRRKINYFFQNLTLHTSKKRRQKKYG